MSKLLPLELTHLLHEWVDSVVEKEFQRIQRLEGCPHFERLKGHMASQNAVLAVDALGGIAWKVGGHIGWYWHPQADFSPITAQVAYRKEEDKVVEVRPIIPGRNCERCVACIHVRAM